MGILPDYRRREKLDKRRTLRKVLIEKEVLIVEDPFPITRLEVENLDIDQLIRVAGECDPEAITFRSVRLRGTKLSVLMAVPLGEERLSKEDLARAYDTLMWMRKEAENCGTSDE